ncbi:hypothetical protein GC207_06620 [bacterium]|nr:hypothetical protein [bacterium]
MKRSDRSIAILRRGAIAIAAFVALLASSVHLLRSNSGDVVEWMVKETTEYGGRPNTNITPSRIDGRWHVKRDRNGFEAKVFNSEFSSVNTALRQIFGTPLQSRTNSSEEGPRYSLWAAKDVGVAIIFTDRTNHLEISCVRGLHGLSEMMDEMEKPWWKKIKLW